MMRLLNNKTNVKIVSIVVAVVFVIGIGALAYTQMATPAMASAESNIGVVDSTKVLTADSPLLTSVEKEFADYQAQLKTEYETQAASLDDQGKQQLMAQTQEKLQAKHTELQKSIQEKVGDASKSVAEAKGLTVVLDKAAVLYGGVDITEQVTKKLANDSAK